MWDGWSINRVILLFTGIAFLMISVQVTLFHYRQNFRHWAMYGPVIGGPIVGVLTLVLVAYNIPLLRTVMLWLFVAEVLLGAVGSALHFNGIGQRVGGYQSQNFLVGPPLVLPMMLAALSILGIIALYWR